MVEHASLANLVEWHRTAFALSAERPLHPDRQPRLRRRRVGDLAQPGRRRRRSTSSPRSSARDPVGLRDWLVAEGITVTFLPTAVAEAVIGLAWPDDSALRYLLTGGDALTRRPPAGPRLHRGQQLRAERDDGGRHLGRGRARRRRAARRSAAPIAGVMAEVVDEDLRPVGPATPGELVIGGVAVGARLPQPARAHRRALPRRRRRPAVPDRRPRAPAARR